MADEAYIEDPNYFDPPPKQEPPKRNSDMRSRPLWVPRHGEGTIRGYFLRPTATSGRISRRGHYNPVAKTTFWCESCTDVSRWGDLCDLVKAQVTRAMAKDPNLVQKEAQRLFMSGERFYYPFYAWKSFRTREGDMRETEVGTAGLELNYTAAYTQLGAASEKLGKRCKSCGANNSISRKGWACTTCDTEVVWDEDARKKKENPNCPKCKAKKPARELVACSKCKDGARLTIYDTLVTITKLSDGKTVDFDFELPASPPPDSVASAERFDLRTLVPYSDPDVMLKSFGLMMDDAPSVVDESFIDESQAPF